MGYVKTECIPIYNTPPFRCVLAFISFHAKKKSKKKHNKSMVIEPTVFEQLCFFKDITYLCEVCN